MLRTNEKEKSKDQSKHLERVLLRRGLAAKVRTPVLPGRPHTAGETGEQEERPAYCCSSTQKSPEAELC